jgi:hypothetical protein
VRGAFPGRWSRRAPGPRLVAALVASVAALLVPASASVAAPPPLTELDVQGGEEAWHPTNRFWLRLGFPHGLSNIAAIRYRILGPGGWPAGEGRVDLSTELFSNLSVPPIPGAYAAQVWLEDSSGAQGPALEATLRFDDTRPGAVAPLPAATWVGRNAFPLPIQLTHPAGAMPPSGLRGFAVSVDGKLDGEPCAGADSCSDSETDLHGAGNDSFTITGLPEGTNYVHAVAVSGSGLRSTTTGRAVLRVDSTDPTVRLSGAPAGWSDRALTLLATASDAGSGMQPGQGAVSPFTAIRIDGGMPVTAEGDSVSASLVAEGIHSVAYYARDLAGNVADGGVSNGLPDPQPATATVRIDRTPPRVFFANAQDPLEPESIRARIADGLSGPDTGRGWIGIRRAGSGDPFEPLPATAPANGELRTRWDSDSYPPCDYEFKATAYDRAGNVAESSRRADGATMVLSNPLKAPTAVSAALGGSSLTRWHCTRRHGRRRCRRHTIDELSLQPAQRTVPYGRRVLLSGRLRDAAGSPLGGSRPVQVIESFAGGGAASVISTVWTDAGGNFALPLPPGPSREVRVEFAGSPTLTRSQSRPLDLRVRSVVRLHASAAVARVGGAPLVFSGRVEAAPGTIPATGRPVELQFRLPGMPWSEFRTVQADRHGRFRYAYRFSDEDSRGARFQFRAYAPAQDGRPYEPAGSLPVSVRGA